MPHRGFAPIILLIVAAILAAGIGGYVWFAAKKATNTPSAPAAQQGASSTEAIPSPAPSPSTTPASSLTIDTSNWQTYRNEEYRFELKYPPNFKLTEGKTTEEFIIISPDAPTTVGHDYFSVSWYPTQAGAKFDASCEMITFAGEPAERCSKNGEGNYSKDERWLQFAHDRINYAFNYFIESSSSANILSTFRFIQPTSTSSL